ncbi:Methenyltetrahydrofolate synthase domain-containing protein [Eumeta japonica]|uniref:Methenyltetrahydrofolate synthase domain-containing protein n=1 Tax=Eumeta variegata TaxID=151549 RepID=A0A4C1VFV9_EUMVA|nr:Methenyltetrahydrofolate synthase domain-containing protein [Eumeta japonica]
MQNGEDAPATTDSPHKTLPEEVTKHSFRLKVWRQLENSGLAMFPRPVYNRIPNFKLKLPITLLNGYKFPYVKGAIEAAAKLAELEAFQTAKTVKVNPDKPQEAVRALCLEKKKTLYVPVPRLQSGFLNRLELPPGETSPLAIKKAVSRSGMDTYGKPVGLDQTISLDLIVMGSVAVSRDGYRIGKGRGYGDLEFGLMMHMKAVKPNTLIVTTVHDCQVFDTLPAELFGPHDVPVDVIITPTQVIETKRTCERPAGILWHLLSARRLQLMPVLAQLRDMEMLAGQPCALKEVDTDVEERAQQARARRLRRRTRSHKSQSEGELKSCDSFTERGRTASGGVDGSWHGHEPYRPYSRASPRHRKSPDTETGRFHLPCRPRRRPGGVREFYFNEITTEHCLFTNGNTTEGEVSKEARARRTPRRRNSARARRTTSTGEEDGPAADGAGHANTTPVKPRKQRKPWPVIDFTVKISNIGPNTRVRELKSALSERGVKPQIMIWKGFRGFCYLHFIKPGSQKGEGDTAPSVNMESVLAALKEMSIGGANGAEGAGSPDEKPRVLHVEPAAPRPPRQPAAAAAAAPATAPAPIAAEVAPL